MELEIKSGAELCDSSKVRIGTRSPGGWLAYLVPRNINEKVIFSGWFITASEAVLGDILASSIVSWIVLN